MSKAQKNFLSGALILTVANAMVNVIGAFYKIPLANLITPTGMNYYNDGYQIYALLFVLSTAGVPVAISKMVSEAIAGNRKREPRKILKYAMVIFGIIGFVMCSLMILFVRPLSGLLQNGETVNYCIAMIAPSIFFVCISAVVKGYFQGYKCMTHTAWFQVIEAAFKLVGIGIIIVLIKQGYGDNYMVLACGGVLGVTFGSFVATMFMLIQLVREKELGSDTENSLPSFSSGKISRTIITLAIPISLSSTVMSITSTLDMILVKYNLQQYGLPVEQVKNVYGAYTGATSSLFNLPPSITMTVGVAVLPFLTTAFVKKQQDTAFRNMRSASKIVSLIAMPCAIGMSVMSEPIIKLLYKQSYWDVAIPCLRILSISTLLVSFVSLTGVFLQSVGRVKITLATMATGAVIKLVVNILAVREIGIIGAPIGTFACYGTIFILNSILIKKYMDFSMPIGVIFIKPFLCAAGCCAVAYGIWWGLTAYLGYSHLWLVIALAVAIIVYAVLMLCLKVLEKEDMTLIPKGERIGAFLERKGWIS